jgi:hypothetical protein
MVVGDWIESEGERKGTERRRGVRVLKGSESKKRLKNVGVRNGI